MGKGTNTIIALEFVSRITIAANRKRHVRRIPNDLIANIVIFSDKCSFCRDRTVAPLQSWPGRTYGRAPAIWALKPESLHFLEEIIAFLRIVLWWKSFSLLQKVSTIICLAETKLLSLPCLWAILKPATWYGENRAKTPWNCGRQAILWKDDCWWIGFTGRVCALIGRALSNGDANHLCVDADGCRPETCAGNNFHPLSDGKDGIREYEFKSKHLRVYALAKPDGKIVVMGGKKKTQRKDINRFRELKKQIIKYLQENETDR